MRAKKNEVIQNPTFAFVGTIGKVERSQVFEVASWLWDEGVVTEVFYEDLGTKE